ncbi:MAG: DMT family transporter [Eubacterium sp.]|nr:DMT family transporter [Eubacterium sp.]
MDKIKKLSFLADLGLLLVAIVWGTGFVASKNAIAATTPMMVMAIRFTVAFLVSAIVFFKHFKNIDKATLKAGCIIGFFLFSAFAAQTIGLQYIQAGKQAFLTATNVVMVPFIFWAVKKQRPDRYNFAAAFIMLLGITLLTTDFSTGFAFGSGDTLTLLCAFLFACHIVSVGVFSKDHDPIALTIIQLGFTALLSLIYVAVSGELTVSISPAGWMNTVYLGLFSTFLAFLLQTVCQKYTSSTHAAILMSLESVFGSLFSIILLGDRFTAVMLVGCIVIFLGVITAETKWSFLKKSPDTRQG